MHKRRPRHPVPYILWRIVPAIILASFGLLFASLGGYSCWVFVHGLWSFEYSHVGCCVRNPFRRRVDSEPVLALVRAKWLVGWTSTLIGLVLYIVCTTTQYVAFLPSNDVVARHQADSATGPVGPNAVSILETCALNRTTPEQAFAHPHWSAKLWSVPQTRRVFNGNEKLFSDDYVVVKIDEANMVGGLAVEDHLRQGRQEGAVFLGW